MKQCHLSWIDAEVRASQRHGSSLASLTVVFLTALLSVIAGCGPKEPAIDAPVAEQTDNASAAQFRFPVVDSSGIEFLYRNGREAGHYSILESLGGGAAIFDADGDGKNDVFVAGGGYFSDANEISGHSSGLFVSRGKMEFRSATTQSGLDTRSLYSHGCAVTDYDNDGFPDLVVTGYGVPLLFVNCGDGTFKQKLIPQTEEGEFWMSSAGWADIDADGFPDLYMCQYVDWSFDNHPSCPGFGSNRDVCPPRSFEPLDDLLYLNDAAGSFSKATDIGLVPGGKGLGVLLADVDGDRDVDIYVANDTTENFLYLNDGRGRLKEDGLVRGVALDGKGAPNGSMGLALTDFDESGLPDLWVTNYEDEQFAMYRNTGGGNFLHASRDTGVAAMGGHYVGFGTIASDFDVDGDEDIAIANGHVVYHPKYDNELQQPVLLRNDGKRFKSVAGTGYFESKQAGRGLAAGDLNRDGRPDLVAVPTNQSVTLAVNDTQPLGKWVRLRLIARTGNRDAVGTQVTLHCTSGDQYRQRTGGGSYASASEPDLFFGIPPGADVEGLTVHWLDGSTEHIDGDPTQEPICVVQQRGWVTMSP
ncbi:MAG: hypothetical protein Fues2KO_11700 [Fuerstiella sp.]